MEMKRKKIAVFFIGGNISLYKDPETSGVFAISSKEDIKMHIPDLEKDCDVRFFTNLPIKKSFLGMLDWKVVFEHIIEKCDGYDGFIIAQETDSLLFGAGIFSYLCKDFGKPIIFTSSSSVVGETKIKGLAQQNLQDSIAFAQTDICEVAVCSNGKLIRASRAKRNNIFSPCVFSSSGIDDIGVMENGVPKLFLHRLNRNNEQRKFSLEYPEKNIFFIKLFPDFNPDYFEDIIYKKNLDAILIESLGYGSIKPNLLNTIEEISLSGIKVVILAKYDNDERKFFLDADTIISPFIVLLKNIPTWSAFAKLHCIAQNYPSAIDFKKTMLSDICGEII